MIDLFGNSVQLLGMPLSSAALFLLAGTLLGHLLWYRDHGKAAVSNPDLETRYLKIRSSLKQRKNQVKELQKQNASIDEDLAILRQAHSTLRSKHKRLEQISQSSQDEINQFRHSLNEAEIQLGNEEKRSQTVIEQLQEMIENNATLTIESQSHQESFERLDQQYRQRISELETAQCELDTFRTQARAQQTELEQKQGSIRKLEEHIVTKEQSFLETREALQETQRDLVARCEDIDALRTERDHLRQQSQAHVHTLTRLETDLTSSKLIQAERDELAKDLAVAANSLAEQRQALDQCESHLELQTTKLAEREQQLSDLNVKLVDERENRLQLEQFNTACQKQLADLESQLSVETTACAQSDLALNTAQNANAESQVQISHLSLELAQSNTKEIAFRSKVADLQKTVERQEQQVIELCAIREENVIHSLELAETRAQLALETSALAELREKANDWHAVQTELETAQQTIQQYHIRNTELESRFLQNTVQITELSRQAACVPELELALKHRQSELELACSQIEQHEANVLTAERICDETEGELAITIAEIHALEDRILSMSNEVGFLSTDNALLSTANQQAAEHARQMQRELKQASISQQQLDECHTELQVVKQECEQLTGTRDDLEATVSRLGKQITNHLTEAKQLNERLSQTAIEHEKLELAFKSEVEARDTTIAELKTQLKARSQQHDAIVDDLAAKTSKLDERQTEIDELTNQLEMARTAHDQKLQLTAEINEVKKQLKSKSQQCEALVNDISMKSNEVAQQLREIEGLSNELDGARSDRKERDLLRQEVTELRAHLGCIRKELEDSLDTNAKGQDQIRDMENQLHDHVKKIRDLRRERNAASAIQITDDPQKPKTASDKKAA